MNKKAIAILGGIFLLIVGTLGFLIYTKYYSTKKTGITKILWPDSGDDFLAEITSGNTKIWSFYNSQTGVFEDLAPQVTALDWMPGGKEILYIWLENGKASLNRSEGDTKNWKFIA